MFSVFSVAVLRIKTRALHKIGIVLPVSCVSRQLLFILVNMSSFLMIHLQFMKRPCKNCYYPFLKVRETELHS